MTEKVSIILASASPRRHEILNSVGIPHRVLVTGAEENPSGRPTGGESYAEYFAAEASKIKGAAALSSMAASKTAEFSEDGRVIIVSSDTVVSPDGEVIFGKPSSRENAREMLRALSGKAHFVVGGITVTDGEKTVTRSVVTKVFFKTLSREEIDAYVATGEGDDKAGAYGIQSLGGRFVERIEGDYQNVVGISAFVLWKILSEEFGLK